jgi:N-formylglutamate amidohydrolase
MILHIPHASTNVLKKTFLCDVDTELERMTDIDTDKLYDYPNATKIIFPVSRLVCDVERFEKDEDEEMSKYGMGVCYTQNALGEPLRNVEPKERNEIIQNLYRPHHERLTETVKKELNDKNTALLIDCHSFPNYPLPCNISQDTPRPDICIGTDSFHTPEQLVKKTEEFFIDCGYTVAINHPFSGTLIPMKYYQSDRRVKGIMLEVNRSLYKDNFNLVKQNISLWLRELDKFRA